MIIIIDGTGDWSNEDYDRTMQVSFCRRLAKEVAKNGQYFRGPSAAGLEVGTIANRALEAARSVPAERPLFLCGYSRGGLVAINVARQLYPRAIKAMFLFDAVDRAPTMESEKISDNVKTVYHALRDPSFTQVRVKETRAALQKANEVYDSSRNRLVSAFLGPDPRLVVPVRERINAHAVSQNANFYARNDTGVSISNFGNTGLVVDPKTKEDTRKFDGSHGALGGVPWSEEDVKGDTEAARKVQSWMWARLIKEGVLGSAPH